MVVETRIVFNKDPTYVCLRTHQGSNAHKISIPMDKRLPGVPLKIITCRGGRYMVTREGEWTINNDLYLKIFWNRLYYCLIYVGEELNVKKVMVILKYQ